MAASVTSLPAASPSPAVAARAAGTASPAAAAPATPAAAAASRAAQKGQQTRAAILDAALGLASQMGLEGLSIGALAEVMQMSKSGVFAHFGSREELQISVIREYHARFEEEVFFPAIREARGLPRLEALFERWIRRVSFELDSGCIYISGAVEFDDRPGPVRDALATMVRTWHAALDRAIRAAVEAGHLRPDTDAEQMLFEIHGLILALHHDSRFLRNPGVLDRARVGFERVVAHYRAGAPAVRARNGTGTAKAHKAAAAKAAEAAKTVPARSAVKASAVRPGRERRR
ncbi:MAG: TetR/AcrR family transcriptional regulator [Rubrivivax sp.]